MPAAVLKQLASIPALFLVVLLMGTASPQDLQQDLNQQYRDKVLFLRHCLAAASQEYDSEGRVLTKSEEEPWPRYGRIIVRNITISENKLELEGNREIYQFDESKQDFVSVADGERLTIRISVSRRPATLDETVAILGRVFAVTQSDVINVTPPIWRPYLDKKLGIKEAGVPTSGAISNAPENGSQGAENTNDKPHSAYGRASAPAILLQKSPDLSQPGGKVKAEGTVGLNADQGRQTVRHGAG
jgi:hypothetical protein